MTSNTDSTPSICPNWHIRVKIYSAPEPKGVLHEVGKILTWNGVGGEVEETKTTKAELTSALHDAFAYCGKAYNMLTDANANETVKAFGQERNKLGALWFNASHNLEHYGNLVVYLRLKEFVPPPSDPKPR